MRNRKIKKLFYSIISTEITLIFGIKIMLDSLQESFSTGISNIFFTKIVISSILFPI